MALNNFMHPRNIYKTPPDFGKLAKTYPEFFSICKMVGNMFFYSSLRLLYTYMVFLG